MVTKHFFKILIVFTGMIILGLVGILLVDHFDEGKAIKMLNNAEVAK